MSQATSRSASRHDRSDRSDIEALGPWFHNLHLPDGRQTAPGHFLGDFPTFKWRELSPHLPGDLTGWSVLDIGCNAGFYSFELAKRGANVLGVDHDETYLRQAQWAVKQYGLDGRVSFEQMQVYDLHQLGREFDLILFMGVFYHLRYPLLALDLVSSIVKRLLVFQTLTMPGTDVLEPEEDYDIQDRGAMLESGWPKMAFIEHRLAGDPTNWWAPNHACIEAMLRSSGMRVIDRPMHETYLCEPGEKPFDGEAWVYAQREIAARAAMKMESRSNGSAAGGDAGRMSGL